MQDDESFSALIDATQNLFDDDALSLERPAQSLTGLLSNHSDRIPTCLTASREAPAEPPRHDLITVQALTLHLSLLIV